MREVANECVVNETAQCFSISLNFSSYSPFLNVHLQIIKKLFYHWDLKVMFIKIIQFPIKCSTAPSIFKVFQLSVH